MLTQPLTQYVYSVTPPLPPHRYYVVCRVTMTNVVKNVLVFVSFFGLTFLGYSQDSLLYEIDSLPSTEILIESLGEYHKEEATYEIGQYTYIEKWKWLKYAPSFGWNFISNTPYIGYNSTDLFNAINYKRKKTAHLESIIYKINQQYNKNSIELVYQIDLYESKILIYKQKIRIIELEKTYFGVLKEEYETHKLLPTKYIKADIAYQNKILELTKLRFELKQLRAEILQLAYFGERITLITSYNDVSTN